MNGSHSSRLGEAVNFLYAEFIMREKLLTADAVTHVSLITGILVKPSKRRRVDGKVNA
jgi:hypothetical protein